MSTFQSGQKCVCVYSGTWFLRKQVTILSFELPIIRRKKTTGPKKDEVCFITGTMNNTKDGQILQLKGYEEYGWYMACFFRPLTFGDAIVEELEKAILNPTPDTVEKQ